MFGKVISVRQFLKRRFHEIIGNTRAECNWGNINEADAGEYIINGVRYVVSSQFSTTEEKILKDKLSDFIGSDFAQLTKAEERNTMQEEYFCLTAGKEVSCSLK